MDQTLVEKETLQTPAGPFDELAAAYDSSFTQTALGIRLRAMVWQRFDAAFIDCRRILEIGCGTGEDAIYLARRGHDVIATDASPSMLRIAKEKVEHAGCAQCVKLHCVPMEDLGREFSGELFDGVCSNFGAINCTSRLDAVVADIAPLLRSDAPLVWVVMGRHVPWEWGWYFAQGNWKKAFRRRRKGGAIWRGTRILYPTPRELSRLLAPYFEPVRRCALGLALPPTFASHWIEGSPHLLSALTCIERAAQRWQPLAALADHYIMEARRVPAHADV